MLEGERGPILQGFRNKASAAVLIVAVSSGCGGPEVIPSLDAAYSLPSASNVMETPSAKTPDSLYFNESSKEEIIPGTLIKDREKIETGSEALDINYLNDIFIDLQKEKGDKESRAKAILENLRLIYRGNGEWASALQIDESGYYLTAHHSVFDKDECAIKDHDQLEVYDPNTNESRVVSSYIASVFHPDDVSIVYAPTGKPKKSADNIQIDLRLPDDGKQLWLAGFTMPSEEQDIWRLELTGKVDQSVAAGYDCYPELLGIRGMIPYGGSSGGPVWDENGRVVALESSFFPLNAGLREDYKGAAVQPLEVLSNFSEYSQEDMFIHANGRYIQSGLIK